MARARRRTSPSSIPPLALPAPILPALTLPTLALSALILGALVSWSALGQTPANRGAVEVSGLVVDANDDPLAGIRVVAYPAQGPHALGRSFLRGTDPAALQDAVVVRTTRDGNYRLRLPRRGLWNVQFDGSGPAGDLAPARILALSPVLRDTVLRTVELREPEMRRLRVLDTDGRPIRGARVEIASFSYGAAGMRRADRYPLLRAASVVRRSGAEGWVEGPTSGRNGHVLVSAEGYLPVRLAWSSDESLETVRLVSASRRDFVVQTSDGRPAAGTIAFVRDIAVAEVGPDGSVGLPVAEGVAEEVVFLTADLESARVPLTTGSRERPIRLAPPRTMTVEVRGGEPSRPVESAWVWEDWSTVARTGDDGRAALQTSAEFLSPHHWAPQRTRRAVYGFAPDHFVARSGDLDDPYAEPIVLALDRAGRLTGVVVDEKDRAVRGAMVLAAPTDLRGSQIRRQVLGGVTAQSADDGSFELFSLDPSVELELSARARGFARTQSTRNPIDIAGTDPVRIRMLRGILASGQVTDEGGAPIVGAVVRLVPSISGGQDFQDLVRQRFRSSAPTPEAVSDPDGRFEFLDLGAATYVLEVFASGFAPSTVTGLEIQRWQPEESEPGASVAPRFDIGTVVLIPGQVLEGIVRSAAGSEVAGATVQLLEPRNTIASLGREQDPVEYVTDEDGRFSFDSLAAEVPYALRVSADGFARAEIEGLRLPLEEPFDLRLDPAADLRGRVVGPEGQPIQGAFIMARGQVEGEAGQAPEQSFTSSRTDEDGRFVLENLARARWSLTAGATGYVSRPDIELSVRPPETPEDLTIRLEKGAKLTGRVTGPDGEGVPRARIQRRQTETADGQRFSMAGGRSEGDGRFIVEGFPIGPASISISAEGYLEAVRDLDVQPGENTIDVQLDRGFSISGIVVDADGQPVAGAEMGNNRPGTRRFNFGRNAGSYSQADGTFEVGGLAPGLYEVTASKDGFAVGRTEEPVQIDGASVSGVRIELSPGTTVTGTISGLAFDELGRTTVYASEEDGGGMPIFTQPDYEGTYRLEGLAAGRWTVSAAVEDGKNKGESLEIAAGETERTVDFEFGTGVQVRGVVVRGEEPVSGATVRLQGLEARSGGVRTTDAAGRFVFDDIEPGSTEVSVSLGRGFDAYREVFDLQIDEELVLRLGGARLPVRVVDRDSGRALAGARLTIEREESFGFRSWGALATDDAGRLVLSDLQPGEQTLHVEMDEYGVETVTTTVTDGENPELLIGLNRASGLWVTLLDAAGRPLRAGTYTLLDADSNVQIVRQVQPDENGGFRLADLAPGTRDVAFADQRGTVARRTIQVPAVGEAGESITVRLPPAGDVRVEIPALRGTQRVLEVRVLDAAGQPVVSPRTGARRRSFGEVTFLRALPVGRLVVEATTRDGAESWSGEVTVREGAQVTLTLP